MEMLLTNSRHPLSLRRVVWPQLLWAHLLAGLPQDGVFQLLSGIGNPSPEVLSCSLFIGAVLSWLLICLVAARELANSRSETAEKIGFSAPAFFVVAICNCRDKYIVHNCIQLRPVSLEVGRHCSDAISQLTFEPAHKCCRSCLRFYLCCSSLVVHTINLLILELICRIHFHFQCSHPDTFSHLLWC